MIKEDQKITNDKIIKTKADIDALSIHLRIKIDQRSSFQYFLHDLKDSHPLINIFLVKSILNPFFIRLIEIAFGLSLTFSLNALFFTDKYINKQADVKTEKGSHATGFWFVLLNEFSKSLWSLVITIIIMILARIIKKVPESLKKILNTTLVSVDKQVVLNGM